MEYMTMAQSIGEEEIHDSGWTRDELDEWYGDDIDAMHEGMAFERDTRLTQLHDESERLREQLMKYTHPDDDSTGYVDGWD